MYVYIYVCMYVCMYYMCVCMYVCMYVCVCVCVYEDRDAREELERLDSTKAFETASIGVVIVRKICHRLHEL